MCFKDENMLNQDAHLKLLKLYLKTEKISKAIRHLIKLEYTQPFKSLTWYKNAIEAVETYLNSPSSTPLNKDLDMILLTGMLTILLSNQLKLILSSSSEIDFTEALAKYSHFFAYSMTISLLKLLLLFFWLKTRPSNVQTDSN